MRKNNKFKIEEFQLSEELKAVLRKGHPWHFGLVWLLLLAGGYGIFKTAKAIKAEGGE